MSKDISIVKKEFNQIATNRVFNIPDNLDDRTVYQINSISEWALSWDWARAALVRAWVRRGDPGNPNLQKQSNLPNGTELGQLSMREFARLGIKGLSSRETVRHYWHAWERSGYNTPRPGRPVELPEDPFPEWGTITDMGGTKSSTGNVWYTPKIYVEAARDVMGGIDLDPATDETGNEIIRAAHIITEEDIPDGLNREWFGKVWLNPPYGKGSGLFTTKLVEEYESGRVNQAILLLNAYGFDSSWFQPLWDNPVCFTDHRIVFTNPDRESGGPANANIFIYFGKNDNKFRDTFSQFGNVVRRWDE